MDFLVDDHVRDLTELVRDIAGSTVDDESLAELDARFGPGCESGGTSRESARFHEPLWSALVRSGVISALAPGSVDGAELGVVAEALVMRELGRVLAPVPLSSAVRATWLLDAAGRHRQSGEVSEGTLLAAVGEAGAAEVDWAPIADLVLLPGDQTLQVLDSPAVERTVPVDFSCAGVVSPTGDAVRVPAEIVEIDALRRRVHLAAHQWGVLEAALERTCAYAAERRQFGRPIGSFQSVAARLADGLIDVDAVRLSTLRAAYELDARSGAPTASTHAAVASAHFWACEAGHRLAHTTVHVHGGVGLDRDSPAHRYFLSAKANEFRLGGATRQLLDLGEVLATIDSADLVG